MSIHEDERYYLKLKALYYLYTRGLTQTEIAKMLNISRVTLGRLLEEARAEGMVRVEIVDVRNMLSLLRAEEELKPAGRQAGGRDRPGGRRAHAEDGPARRRVF